MEAPQPPGGPDPFLMVYAWVDAHLIALGTLIAFIIGVIWKAAHIDREVKALRDDFQTFVAEYREDIRARKRE